jgi:hypothetical protein
LDKKALYKEFHNLQTYITPLQILLDDQIKGYVIGGGCRMHRSERNSIQNCSRKTREVSAWDI